MCARDLEKLAREAFRVIRAAGSRTALLINSRTDVALAVEADGVYLRADDVSPQEVRRVWEKSGVPRVGTPVIGVSCHSVDDVARAAAEKASFALFAPVFGK